ncbi:fibroblast growth factor receptor 2 isoform X1 [Octopus vulgaris]|uniref:Fibroblast growth factor receptor 2 isoform X1 n=1 Tax=Octopus vulgaris TaxID=6645 RepID=A0AA36FHP3_OCTVU|nr:fibroblast growth factor receptor 2 isoform X1 [Octopus vulgaris]
MFPHWFLPFLFLFSPLTANSFPSKPVFESSAKISGNDLIVHEGEEVSVSCKLTGNPPPTVTLRWMNTTDMNYHKNTSVKRIEDYIITNLYFTASRRHHNQEIRCKVTDDGQDPWAEESFLLLHVNYLDNLIAYAVPSSVVAGGRVAFVCKGSGRPAVNKTWTKSGSSWEKDAKELFILNNVSLKGTGIYICTMWNAIVLPAPAEVHEDVTAAPILNALLIFCILIFLLLFVLLVLVLHYIYRTIPLKSRSCKRRLPNLPLSALSRSEDRVHPQVTVKVTQSSIRTANPAAAQGEGPLPTRAKNSRLPNIPGKSEHPYVNTSTTHADYLELVDENCSEDKSEDLLYEEPGESYFRPTEPARKSSSSTLLP